MERLQPYTHRNALSKLPDTTPSQAAALAGSRDGFTRLWPGSHSGPQKARGFCDGRHTSPTGRYPRSLV